MLWFEGSAAAAVTAARGRNVLMVVYVRGDDEVSARMDATWEDEEVSKLCRDADMVAIRFNANSEECKQFSQHYPVICIPSVSFICGGTGVPLEGVAGHVTPAEFKQKIQKVIKMSKQGSPPAIVPQADVAATAASGTPQASQSVSQTPSATPSQASAQPQPLSSQLKELSKLEKAARLRQKMEEIHQRKEAKKEEELRKKEIERRKVGQAVQHSTKDRADEEARKVAAEIRKEKEEDRLAKERVREQIARDRAEKQSRYEASKKEKEQALAAARDAAKTADNPPKRKINMDIARIQFRLPDGSTLTQQFDAKAPLQDAQQFLTENLGSSLREFTMSTTFPRRRFAAVDMNSTFLELELVPTAAVIVLPGRYSDSPTSSNLTTTSVKPADSPGGFIAMLLAPLLFVWNFIINFIFGQPSSQSNTGGNSPVPSQQTTPPAGQYAQSTTGARPKSSQVRRRTPGPDSFSSRQEGNIHRLVTRQDNDDDTNTWNGNSTQQM